MLCCTGTSQYVHSARHAEGEGGKLAGLLVLRLWMVALYARSYHPLCQLDCHPQARFRFNHRASFMGSLTGVLELACIIPCTCTPILIPAEQGMATGICIL